MCTLSIIPWRGAGTLGEPGVRIACNRDESRLRPRAVPPELRQLGPHRALLPIDPQGGGTWIAASDAPLALVLMNVYTRPLGSRPLVRVRTSPAISRGTIIPQVAAAGGLDAALERARGLELSRYEPFRLVLVDQRRRAEIEWSDDELKVTPPAPVDGPWFCTSSGLGDEMVAAPRRRLFAETLTAADAAAWPERQVAFHRHVWPERREASVWMTRAEARTVSLTVVEMGPRAVRMRYFARDDDDSPADRAIEATLAAEGVD